MATAIQVVQSAASAERLLKPERLQILGQLAQPDSAAGVAKRLKLPRQTVNYHLRELEKDGFVEFIEQRPKGNCLERVVRATARSYVISPVALGALGLEASEVRDRFSAAYLVSTAARTIRDVTILRQRAGKEGKKIATLTVETEVRFRNAKALSSSARSS
jgi:DNA-binding transcriptional ArsR family regulator